LPNQEDKKVWEIVKLSPFNKKYKTNTILENLISRTTPGSTLKLDKKSTKQKQKKYPPKKHKINSAKLIKYKNDKNDTKNTYKTYL
jgi:hypothetical protein